MRKAQFLIFIVYLAFNKHSMDESRGGVSPLPIFLHSYCVSCYFLSTAPKSCFTPPLYSKFLLSSKSPPPPPTSKNYTVSLRVIVNSCKDIVCLYKIGGPKPTNSLHLNRNIWEILDSSDSRNFRKGDVPGLIHYSLLLSLTHYSLFQFHDQLQHLSLTLCLTAKHWHWHTQGQSFLL